MKITNYTLNKTIVYEPETHSLYNTQSSQERLSLAISASLCLLKLLEEKDKIVSHDSLLSYVWGARGMNVSANTIYQNISILRKSLLELGLEDEFIKTVPKRGFIISGDVDFEVLNEDSSNNRINQLIINSTGINEALSRHVILIKLALPVLLFSIICYASYKVILLSFFSSPPDYISPKYRVLEELNGCHVFRNFSLRDDVFFKEIIATHKLECKNEKWWYFTNSPPDPEVSLLRCSDSLNNISGNNKLLCVSDFYFDGDRKLVD